MSLGLLFRPTVSVSLPAPVPPVEPAPIVTAGAWSFVICDTAGVPIGEPLPYGRTYNTALSQTETASFRVRTGTSLWSEIAAGDTTIKVYDSTGRLTFFGDIVSDELVASGTGGTVAVNAADVSYRLTKRLTGKDFAGVGMQFVDQDPGRLVFDALAFTNAEFPTGIIAGNRDTFVHRTLTVLWKTFYTGLSELGAIEGSYEWKLRYEDGIPPTVYLDLLVAHGSDRSADVFFEYGTGDNNCSSYRRLRTIDGLVTRMYVTGGTTGTAVVAWDAGAELTRRFEEILTVGDITDVALLDAIAAQNVAVRHVPRRTVSVTPIVGGAPRFGDDWFIGDYVTVRAIVDGMVDADGKGRIWSAGIAIDELGNEQTTPVLGMD